MARVSPEPSIARACEACGAQFMAKASLVRKGWARFCSFACSNKPRDLADKFWSRVDKNGPVPAHAQELGPCWLWTGSLYWTGYGRIRVGTVAVGDIRSLSAHRVAFFLEHGRWPEFALHRCDNRPCVRHAHLFEGTKADNTADMNAKGRNRANPPRGEQHGCAKLTEDDVRQIRAALARGETGLVVAVRHGVSNATISDIKHGNIWGHVT